MSTRLTMSEVRMLLYAASSHLTQISDDIQDTEDYIEKHPDYEHDPKYLEELHQEWKDLDSAYRKLHRRTR